MKGSDSMSPTVPPISISDVALLATSFAGGLDFVGDVRNDLHGFAEVIAAPFLGDDLLVEAAVVQLLSRESLAWVKRS